MILNEVVIRHRSRSDRFHIYCLGDIHLGNKACDVKKLKEHIQEIANLPNAYWIGLGDYIEAINYTDKRFDHSQVDQIYANDLSNAANEQMQDLILMLEPIKKKCIGIHRGNHEECLRLKYHFDVLAQFKERWKDVVLLEDTAFTRLVFKRAEHHVEKFMLWSSHSNAGGRKSGSKINRVEDAMAIFDADIYVVGHGHRKIITSLTALSVSDKGEMHMIARRRIGGMTGAYFRTYLTGSSTYGEKALFSPSDLGCVKITIDPADRNYFMSEV